MSKKTDLIKEFHKVFKDAKPTLKGEIIDVIYIPSEDIVSIEKSFKDTKIVASIDAIGYSNNNDLYYYLYIKCLNISKSIENEFICNIDTEFRNIKASDVMNVIDAFRDKFFEVYKLRKSLSKLTQNK